MTIKDYKLIQADGNMALAVEVMRFVVDGWEPVGAPFRAGKRYAGGIEFVAGVMVTPVIQVLAQAIILREPESAELKRLRDIERHVDHIVTELDNPIADELGMVTFAHEELEKVLRGGPFERKR